MHACMLVSMLCLCVWVHVCMNISCMHVCWSTMSMYMCTCMYLFECIHAYVHTYSLDFINARMHAHKDTCVHASNIHAYYMHACVNTYINGMLLTCAFSCTCTCTYTQQTHTHSHAYAYIYTYTRTWFCLQGLFIDDDKQTHLEFEFAFDLKSGWT